MATISVGPSRSGKDESPVLRCEDSSERLSSLKLRLSIGEESWIWQIQGENPPTAGHYQPATDDILDMNM